MWIQNISKKYLPSILAISMKDLCCLSVMNSAIDILYCLNNKDAPMDRILNSNVPPLNFI